MSNIVKDAGNISRIAEIIHWGGVILMAAAVVCTFIAPEFAKIFLKITENEFGAFEFNIYGFEVTAPINNGGTEMRILFLFGISGAIIYALMAMIFRNINLMIRKSVDSTPFQNDNIRMMREIGIFSIAVPAFGLIMSFIFCLVFGFDNVEASVNLYGFFMGIIVLCLTEFFAYGVRLQEDVDGLL